VDEALAAIADEFAQAGCHGCLRVMDIDGPGEVVLDDGAPMVSASVFKVLVALEFFRQADLGKLDPAERVRLTPDQRTSGETGFSTFTDEVDVSLRDLARMMIAVSDNAAADALLDRVGLDTVNAGVHFLGLVDTVVTGTIREILNSRTREMGLDSVAGLWDAVRDPRTSPEFIADMQQRLTAVSAVDPRRTTRTTARDMANLLRMVWRNEAGPAPVCEQVRVLMANQVAHNKRLATVFPATVRVSAKSGTLFGLIRNEVGVAEYPDGTRYAMAVFTRANTAYRNLNAIDSAIAAAAARAVKLLRKSKEGPPSNA
jgi:beta-lactamase class A